MSKNIQQRVAACVTPELVQEYHRNGAVCVRGLFSPDEIQLLTQGIEKNLAAPSPSSKVASRPDDPGWFFEDFCNWSRISEYQTFIGRSPAAAAAAELVGGQSIRLYHDHLLVKEPGTQQRTPWHQDQPYYNIEGHQNVSMWIPVDPVPRQATLEFVAGSHLGPWLMPKSFMDDQAKWFPEGTLAPIPNIEANRASYSILAWELEPGDMVCFNMLTLHASGGTPSRRRAFSVRFIGDNVRHAPRAWKTSPEFTGLEKELPAGAPMDHPLFPVVWPVSAIS
ncbi:phytanoyl-CoA dioxygenase family protein [Herbaspirillum sp. GCM10030257]|uniref:phytanoyl-CoA dioxygenase family protein n=1 Tax=Herbaspirillum sp. GCM10030257 TaxID=3273393 RepID=UPI00360C73F6